MAFSPSDSNSNSKAYAGLGSVTTQPGIRRASLYKGAEHHSLA